MASAQNRMLQNGHLPALDGIRALAVLIVVAYHSGIGNFGDLGVTIFFVLSGFLITLLLLREESKTGTVSLRDFYWRRTLRIFPAYYVFIALSFAFDHFRHIQWHPGMLLAGLTYTLDYFNALVGHLGPLGHGWSLAIEEQFYLLWPLLFLFVRNRARFLTIAIAAIFTWRTILYFNGASKDWLYNAFDCRAGSLAIGCLLAVLTFGKSFNVGPRWLSFAPPLLIVASRYFGNDAYHYTLGFTVESLLIAIWLPQAMKHWQWMDWKPIAFVGTISYPIYLYHLWAIGAAEHISHTWRFQVGFAIVIPMACFSYFVIEKPFLKLKSRTPVLAHNGPHHVPNLVRIHGDGSRS